MWKLCCSTETQINLESHKYLITLNLSLLNLEDIIWNLTKVNRLQIYCSSAMKTSTKWSRELVLMSPRWLISPIFGMEWSGTGRANQRCAVHPGLGRLLFLSGLCLSSHVKITLVDEIMVGWAIPASCSNVVVSMLNNSGRSSVCPSYTTDIYCLPTAKGSINHRP